MHKQITLVFATLALSTVAFAQFQDLASTRSATRPT